MDPEQNSVAKEFDQYNENYKEAVNASLDSIGVKAEFFSRVKMNYYIDLLNSNGFAPETAKILDMGCGIGMYHNLLKQKVGDLHGIDVSAKCIGQAKKLNHGVTYKLYDGKCLPYDDNSFDSAVTICVMHHVPTSNRNHFLSEMYRILKPNGLAVVFEHNPLNPLTMRVVNNCPFYVDAVLLKSGETSQLLSNNGFKHTRSRFILSFPPLNWACRQVDKIFARLPFGAQYYTSGRK